MKEGGKMRFFVKGQKDGKEEERCEVRATSSQGGEVSISIIHGGLTYTVMEFRSSGDIEARLDPRNCYKVTDVINVENFRSGRGA